MQRQRIELLVVACLALLLRLAAFFVAVQSDQLFELPDSAEYDLLAWNLAAHGAYSLKDSSPWTPDLTRTPVYPLFVAGCYRLVGRWPSFAVALQISFAASTVLLIWAMGRRFFPSPAALGGAGLLALDPLSIHYATLLLSETLFTLLFTGSLFCLLAYLRKQCWTSVIAAALLTGLAILCRPIAVVWPLALLPGFLLVAWQTRRWRPLTYYLLFLIGVTVVVGPWVFRNERVGGLTVLTTVPGINLYYHRAAVLYAGRQGVSLDEARSLLANRLQEAVQREHLTPAQEYRLMERWGAEMIVAEPKKYLGEHLYSLGRMFSRNQRRPGIPVLNSVLNNWLEAAYLTVLYALGIMGFVWGLYRLGRKQFFLLGIVLAYFAALSGPEAYDRFRVPMMPIIALLAGVGLPALFARPKPTNKLLLP